MIGQFGLTRRISHNHRSQSKTNRHRVLRFENVESRELMSVTVGAQVSLLETPSAMIGPAYVQEDFTQAGSRALFASGTASVLTSTAPSGGGIDHSFGVNGITRDYHTHGASAESVAILGNGKILVAGPGSNSGQWAIAKYNPDGKLDLTFADRGIARTYFSTGAKANDMAVQADGKFLVVGTANSTGAWAIGRYNADGKLDQTFGDKGIVYQYFSHGASANTVFVLADGSILVAGTGNSTGAWLVAKYKADGKLDQSFGQNGIVRTYFSTGARANDMAVQADGKILVVGAATSTGSWAIVRYNADGSLDQTFGNKGILYQYFSRGASANSLSVQKDGSILVAGIGSRTGQWAVAKYKTDGKLDKTFGQEGIARTYFSTGLEANDMAVQTDGKILVVGSANSTGGWATVRYDADGRLDETFGDKGIVFQYFSHDAAAKSVALQADGNIVVAGPGSKTGARVLVRYLQNIPHAPSQLTVQAATSNSIQLAWKDNATNEQGFRVEWREPGMKWQSTTVGANSTSHTVSGLLPGRQYDFRVCAFNGGGSSSHAGPVSRKTPVVVTPPSPPSELTARAATNQSIQLTWRDNSNNEKGFHVEWREPGKSWQSTTVGANFPRYTAFGLLPGTNYEFRVRAFNDAGNSSYAGPVSLRTPVVITPPSAPSQLLAQAATSDSIRITWKDNANNEKGFHVEWRKPGKRWQSTTVGANSASHTVSGLSPANRYEFRVRAFNDAGNSSYVASLFVPSTSFNLVAGEQLLPGQEIRSADNRFRFTLQIDGNLVLYGPAGRALWSTGTSGKTVTRAIMQTDGNFVLYNRSTPVWHTRTHGHPGARLMVQNTGNVVILTPNGTVLWKARNI
jgi:uncharacterized delta-60 repeat protein